MLHVANLIWDAWNVDHIGRHGVTQVDVEQVCRREHVVLQTYAQRLLIVGTNDAGNMLTVVMNPKGDDIYYPVTARPASRKERRLYRGELTSDGD